MALITHLPMPQAAPCHIMSKPWGGAMILRLSSGILSSLESYQRFYHEKSFPEKQNRPILSIFPTMKSLGGALGTF